MVVLEKKLPEKLHNTNTIHVGQPLELISSNDGHALAKCPPGHTAHPHPASSLMFPCLYPEIPAASKSLAPPAQNPPA